MSVSAVAGTPSSLASKVITASFALPEVAGARTRTLREFPYAPAMPSPLAPGCTCTRSTAPSLPASTKPTRSPAERLASPISSAI